MYEVKKVHGQRYCLDVLISDGCLLAGQTIAVCSLRDNGIVTRIKQLQTPSEVQDLRVERAKYDNQSKCQASMACRLVCDQNMEHAVAGSKIYLVQNPKDAEEVEDARVSLLFLKTYIWVYPLSRVPKFFQFDLPPSVIFSWGGGKEGLPPQIFQ